MPIFHMHIINQHSDDPDPEGHDLLDLDVAKRVAIAGPRVSSGSRLTVESD